MAKTIDDAIKGLKGYCKPYDQGGAGASALTQDIKAVLTEIERLHAIVDDRMTTGDGTVIVPGLHVWCLSQDEGPAEFNVVGIELSESGWHIKIMGGIRMTAWAMDAKDLFVTEEAVEDAGCE